MNAPSPAPLTLAERRAARFWPAMIFCLIGGQMALCGVTYYYATVNGPVAIEPDYYAKAVQWNQHAAQLARNRQLGWRAVYEVGEAGDDGRRLVNVSLSTADGQPLEGATLKSDYFHHADANQRSVAQFAAADGKPGVYQVRLPIARPGVWEFRLTAARAGDTFTDQQQLDVGQTVGMFKWRR
jgi:nitrogen fixation protein FixH